MEPTLAGAQAPSTKSATTVWTTSAAAAILLAGTIVFLWRAGDAYQIYKALHVAFAVIWVGGGFAITLMGLMAERSGDSREIATLVKFAEKIGQRVFSPSGVVVFAFGVAMIEKASLGWGVFWLDFALAVFALSFATGAGYLGPTAKKLKLAYQSSGGETTPAIAALQRRVLRVMRFDAVLLLLIVVDMVAKPTF